MRYYSLSSNQPLLDFSLRHAVQQLGKKRGKASFPYTVWSGDPVKFGGADLKARTNPANGKRQLPRDWWVTPGRMKRITTPAAKARAREINSQGLPEVRERYAKWRRLHWRDRASKIQTMNRVLEFSRENEPRFSLQRGDIRVVEKGFNKLQRLQKQDAYFEKRKKEKAEEALAWKRRKREMAEENRLLQEEFKKELAERERAQVPSTPPSAVQPLISRAKRENAIAKYWRATDKTGRGGHRVLYIHRDSVAGILGVDLYSKVRMRDIPEAKLNELYEYFTGKRCSAPPKKTKVNTRPGDEPPARSRKAEIWHNAILEVARGLNLNQPLGRSSFAPLLQDKFAGIGLRTVRELAQELGVTAPSRGRKDVLRELAEAYIKKITGEEHLLQRGDEEDYREDLTFDSVTRAYEALSFSPEQRAESFIEDYNRTLNKALGELQATAGNDHEKKELAEKLFEEFRQGYKSRTLSLLAAKSRMMSSMIIGPARFPTRKNQKALDMERKRSEERNAYLDKFLKRAKNKLHPKTVTDQDDPVQFYQNKIDELEQLRDMMKSINKIIRSKRLSEEQKIEQIMAKGLPRQRAEELLKPDFAGRIGFAPYQLQNLGARIRDSRKHMERAIVEQTQRVDDDRETRFDDLDLTVYENTDADRLQLIFDNIPTPEMRQKLKSNGWRWSPRNKAWQRKLNINSYYSLERTLGISKDQLTGE